MNVNTMIVAWDDLLSIIREAFPKMGKYGGDTGGSAPGMIAFLTDAKLVEEVAERVWKAECHFKAKTAAARQIIEKEGKAYIAERNAIVEFIRASQSNKAAS